MSRKSTIDALFGVKPGEMLGAPNTTQPVVRSGAVAAMGASLQQWSAAQKASEDLAQRIANAEAIIEVDPASIDPAPVRDRLAIETDPLLDGLVESIRVSGQQVPVLLRPHASLPGRFQTAYGHRRIEAARRLARPVRAVVSQLDDAALIIAQGKENSERRDLSFIERALFALRLEEQGIARGLIMAALSTDKADLSRALAVARAVPVAVIEAIGPAPKAGRARWLALAEALKGEGARRQAAAEIANPAFRALGTDRRFSHLITALQPPSAKRNAPEVTVTRALVMSDEGLAIAQWYRAGSTNRIELSDALAPGFATFLAEGMPELYQRFLREQRPKA
jgi:ParB family chromosome partitioning protein